MKTLQTIGLALLLSTFSSAYAGEAYESCLERFGTMNNTVVHGCSYEQALQNFYWAKSYRKHRAYDEGIARMKGYLKL